MLLSKVYLTDSLLGLLKHLFEKSYLSLGISRAWKSNFKEIILLGVIVLLLLYEVLL